VRSFPNIFVFFLYFGLLFFYFCLHGIRAWGWEKRVYCVPPLQDLEEYTLNIDSCACVACVLRLLHKFALTISCLMLSVVQCMFSIVVVCLSSTVKNTTEHCFFLLLLASLKKSHRAVTSLEKSFLLVWRSVIVLLSVWRRATIEWKTALAENYRLGNLFFSHLHFYLLWILLKIIYIIWSFEI